MSPLLLRTSKLRLSSFGNKRTGPALAPRPDPPQPPRRLLDPPRPSRSRLDPPRPPRPSLTPWCRCPLPPSA
ncbi:unnamed protein product [Prunus armeniaca]